MKIVIDIPDEEYEDVKKANGCYYDFGKAIVNGTPLPDNFDLQGLKSDMKAFNCYPYGLDYLLDCLEKRLGITIIEAESEGKE